MKILVTGSTGFIGKAIVEHLTSVGHDVIGLHARHRSDINLRICREIVVDITSWNHLLLSCEVAGPCDAIIHAAASLDMNPHGSDVAKINCVGTQNLLRLFFQWKGKHFVFLSSVPVIGRPLRLPITEEHPTNPLTAYHASKLFGEQVVRLAGGSGATATSLRLTAPVGPCMPSHRLIPTLVRRALNNAPIEIKGQGTRRQNYVDIRDVARATESCLHAKTSGIFNIASEKSITNINLAQKCITRCASSSLIIFRDHDPEEGVDWNVSIDSAKKVLGFAPKFDLDDALNTVIEDSLSDVRK